MTHGDNDPDDGMNKRMNNPTENAPDNDPKNAPKNDTDANPAVFLQVVRGNATPEEIAALVTVLKVKAAAAQRTEPPRVMSAWADRSGQLRQPLSHGSGAWRASALPR